MTIRKAPRACFAIALAGALASPAGAQTDFYNTDRGRPLRTEDAIPVERRAFELQLAPLTFSRLARGAAEWGVAPELAWGIAPRTQVELAVPVIVHDAAGLNRTLTELAGVEFDLLHQLNAETAIPALAIGAGVHLPAGPASPDRALTSVRALVTRTLAWGRLHVNGSYTLGGSFVAGQRGAGEAERWSAGLAMDHTFVFRSLLVGAEVYAVAPLVEDLDAEWHASAGFRKQLSPRLAIDAGLTRTLSAPVARWGLTVGAAYAFAPPTMPGFPRGAR